MKIDFCMAAVIRPKIIEEAMDSWMEHIVEPNPDFEFNIIVNVDPVGESKYTQKDIITLIKNYSNDLVVRMPKNPSVVNAKKWVLEQISADYAMFKEDDIKFLQDLDLNRMVELLKKYKNLSSLHTDKWGVIPGHKRTLSKNKIFRCNFEWVWQGEFYKATQWQRAFSLLPSLTKADFYKVAREYLHPRYKNSPTNILKGKAGDIKGTLFNFLKSWDYGYFTWYGNDKQVEDLGKKWKKIHGYKKPTGGVWQTWQKVPKNSI